MAYEQMQKLGYYHLYRGTTHENAVDPVEKLLSIAPVNEQGAVPVFGSEANDTAIAFWYHDAAIGKPESARSSPLWLSRHWRPFRRRQA